MKRCRLATTAVLLALSVSAVAAPASGASPSAHKRLTHASSRARTFSFYARVVKSSAKGLIVRTADGKQLSFSAAQIARKRAPVTKGHKHHKHHKARKGHKSSARAALDPATSPGAIAINIVGLQPGVTVLITEAIDQNGNITITITLPPLSVTGQQNASGLVNEVDSDAFQITTGDGSVLRLHMAQSDLSNLNLQTCNTVDVTYHQDAGMLIADNVKVTGASTSGDCSPTTDATGIITEVSGSGLTINTDSGPLTFTVASPDVTNGFQSGDVVDVTYTENADGTLNATAVQYVEQDASGVVTAVSATSLAITDSGTGHSETFTADPSQGLQMFTYAFNGVKIGDQVDLTYHQSAGSLVADTVNDRPPNA